MACEVQIKFHHKLPIFKVVELQKVGPSSYKYAQDYLSSSRCCKLLPLLFHY
jgi:hypothetical protein